MKRSERKTLEVLFRLLLGISILLSGAPAFSQGEDNEEADEAPCPLVRWISENGVIPKPDPKSLLKFQDQHPEFPLPRAILKNWDGNKGSTLFSTKLQGTILVKSNGEKLAVTRGAHSQCVAVERPEMREGRLRVWFVGMNKGSSTVLQVKTGGSIKTYVIDPGHRPEPGAEAEIVTFLKTLKVERVEAVLVTHAHGDHFGSTSALLEALPVGTLYHPNYFPEKNSGNQGLIKAIKSAEKRGIPVVPLLDDSTDPVWDGLEVSVLAPKPGYFTAEDAAKGPDPKKVSIVNENSVVIRVQHGKNVFLFTGDIGPKSMTYLVANYPKLINSDVLLIAHHGTNWTRDFERYVSPRIAVANWDKHRVRGSEAAGAASNEEDDDDN